MTRRAYFTSRKMARLFYMRCYHLAWMDYSPRERGGWIVEWEEK